MLRIGNGYDAHRLVPGRPLRLGGVEVPFAKGLLGHSDGDAALHALCDAILGAMADSDIGQLFPAGDERWRDIDSGQLLKAVAHRLEERGFRVINCDLTIVAERPKLAPYLTAMRERIASLLTIAVDCVGLKATTTEKLGFTGREEGIAVYAVALLTDNGEA